MNKKSTPTNPLGNPPTEHFTRAIKEVRELSVSELQSVIIEIAFLIRKKSVEELLSMLETARREEDAKPTDTDKS